MVDALWNVPDSDSNLKGYWQFYQYLDIGDVSIGTRRVRYVGGWGHSNTARSVVLPVWWIRTTQFEKQDATQSCYLTGRAAENRGARAWAEDVRATELEPEGGPGSSSNLVLLWAPAFGKRQDPQAFESGFWKVWLRQDRGHNQHSQTVQTLS